MASAFHQSDRSGSSPVSSLSQKLGVRLPIMTSPRPYKSGSFVHWVWPSILVALTNIFIFLFKLPLFPAAPFLLFL